jgi:predicted small secreted protein
MALEPPEGHRRSEPAAVKEAIIVKRHTGWMAMGAAFVFAVMTAACDNTARGAREDAADAKRDAQEATADVKDKARDEAAKAAAEGREAKDDVRRAAGDAGAAIDAAAETIDVKTALMSDAAVDASDINVDTFHETKTVVLKGSVPSAAQKTEAGNIAARQAEGYKIDNRLVVKPRS